jgi:hypothetical protein
MVNSSESPEKASNLAPQWQSDCGASRIPRSIFKKIAANPETSVGELVKPKSTLKHLFGTGKDSQVSPRVEVLFKYIDLAGVGCRRNYMDVRISAADMFVDLRRSRYGLRYTEFDSKSKDLTKPSISIRNDIPNYIESL